ncbi:MAG: TRAP transporter small permease subunit [Alphaproteobacteria bacterium]
MYRRVEFACAIAILAAIVVLVGVASVARTLGAPIIWSVEIAQLLFVWECMLAADLAMQHDRHFGLSVLLDRLGTRARRIVVIGNLLVLIALLGFLLVYAVINTGLMHPRLIGATQMNASLVHAAMPFGLALMLRTLAVKLWHAIAEMRGTS